MIVPLKSKHVDFYVEQILDSARLGNGIEVFLFDHEIRKSKWNKFAKKHKAIRIAMNDAEEYCKAFALKRVDAMIADNTINSNIAKMYLEFNAGWIQNAKENEQASNDSIDGTLKEIAKELPV